MLASVGIVTVGIISRVAGRCCLTCTGRDRRISVAVRIHITVVGRLDVFIDRPVTIIIHEVTDIYCQRMDGRVCIVTFAALQLVGHDIELLYFTSSQRTVVDADIVDLACEVAIGVIIVKSDNKRIRRVEIYC